jgi:predicted Zn finger-like uncharacterized protein
MDVRCEKCQTEYELDEARLKPGGVTVKCTNCGHMFKIRKRANTNVGAAAPAAAAAKPRPRPGASKPLSGLPRPDSMLDEAETARADDEGPTTVERQWVIRLQNGEQKSCRELATLQQWIIAGIVTRESQISRTGKTWKRLGDITELAQYFQIADEARTTRESRPAIRATPTPPAGNPRPGPAPAAPRAAPAPPPAGRATVLGISGGPMAQASGGTILPDDDEPRTGRALPPKLPVGAKTPPMGSATVRKPAAAAAPPPTALAAPPPTALAAPPPTALAAPPPTALATRTPPSPVPAAPAPAPPPRPPLEGRSTAAWANEPVRPESVADSGPYVGKLSAIPDEPMFAGRFRSTGDPEAQFKTGKVVRPDEDEDLLPRRRGTRAGLWIVLALLAFGGAAAAGVYMFVIKDSHQGGALAQPDPGSAQPPDAAALVEPTPDAPEPPPVSPIDTARGELFADNEAGLRTAFESLAGKDEPAAQAVRAHLAAAIAQALTDRASLVADRAEANKLRRDADTIIIEAATAAQRALKDQPDDAAANLAMAAVLRLQRKPAAAIKRYSDAAKAKGDNDWARDIALADALLLARDGKLDDARAALAAIDQGEGKLETSNDVRARFQLARIALAQGKAADAKPLVEQILAAQPEHAGARALAAKVETAVAKTDPLPPEDPKAGSGAAPRPPGPGPGPGPVAAGGSYDALVKRADALAERDCNAAMALYQKALDQKPNGVEALTGMGYCHVDQKQFASAFSKFRAAIAISSRYEPALWGLGEAYQQQGRKEQAIEAFQRYLEVFPGSQKALRQLDRLGASPGGASPSGGGGGGGSGSPPAPPAPAPAPAPSPAAGGDSG